MPQYHIISSHPKRSNIISTQERDDIEENIAWEMWKAFCGFHDKWEQYETTKRSSFLIGKSTKSKGAC
jgi:hypothetical protein